MRCSRARVPGGSYEIISLKAGRDGIEDRPFVEGQIIEAGPYTFLTLQRPQVPLWLPVRSILHSRPAYVQDRTRRRPASPPLE